MYLYLYTHTHTDTHRNKCGIYLFYLCWGRPT